MNNWLESYKETEWRRDGQTSGPFGEINYEQGSFIQCVYTNYIDKIEYYPWRMHFFY